MSDEPNIKEIAEAKAKITTDFLGTAQDFIEQINKKSKNQYEYDVLGGERPAYVLVNKETRSLLVFEVHDWQFMSHVGSILSYINNEAKVRAKENITP